jgi:hypothetical protein
LVGCGQVVGYGLVRYHNIWRRNQYQLRGIGNRELP